MLSKIQILIVCDVNSGEKWLQVDSAKDTKQKTEKKNDINVPWVDKNDVVKTYWFLGGGVFFSKTGYNDPLFEILTSALYDQKYIIFVRHFEVLLQLYQ